MLEHNLLRLLHPQPGEFAILPRVPQRVNKLVLSFYTVADLVAVGQTSPIQTYRYRNPSFLLQNQKANRNKPMPQELMVKLPTYTVNLQYRVCRGGDSRFGLTFDIDEEPFRVSEVRAPALDAGLLVNDVLLSVNGERDRDAILHEFGTAKVAILRVSRCVVRAVF